jgi:hypothetical protein
MPSTYSSLKIQLMATGENNTTWGTVTNLNLGTAIEEAIVGSADVTFAGANVTLTLTDTNTSQTARNLRLRCTGTTSGARDLIVPAIEKAYIVVNECADTITVKNATGTGVAVPASQSLWVYNNGTNVVNVVTYLPSVTLVTPTLGVASATSIANGLGAVGTPSYTFTGDLNTGMWSPAADTLAFSEGGVEAMRINSTANIGIGTTTIDSRLHVANSTTTNAIALFDGSNTSNVLQSISVRNIAASGTGVPSLSISQWRSSFAGGLDVGQLRFDGLTTTSVYNEFAAIYASAGTNTASGAPTSLVFRTQNASFASAERMRISAEGNLGIGTASPTTRVDIVGPTLTAATSNTYALWIANTGGANGDLAFGSNATAAYAQSWGSKPLAINSQGNNVGIGTASPGAKLDVVGTIFGSSTMTLGSGFNNVNGIEIGGGRTGSNSSYVDLIGDTTYTDFGFRMLRDNTGANATSQLVHRGTGDFNISTQDAAPIVFYTTLTERFRILAAGGITSAALADAVGYKGLPQNSQTAAYTLALSDMGKHISITTGGVLIPGDATGVGPVPFPIGTAISIFNNSGSSQTIAFVATVTDTLRLAGTATVGSRTLAQYGVATILKVASTVWVISGAGVS